MKKKIVLLQGGLGAERDVSFNTAKSFAKALDALGYNYEILEADQNLPANLQNLKPDIVFNALHGKYGEDGTVQGICEYLKIPYTGSGVLASALAMDKIKSKQVLAFEGVTTPGFQILNTKKNKPNANEISLNLPFVVKPAREGSSVGISICKNANEVQAALDLASSYDHNILIEQYILGAEVTVPILAGKALSPIEIVPKDHFYDYEHKYTKGKTDYILPPNLSEVLIKKIQDRALRIFEILGLRAYGRIDFMVDKAGEIYFIEANPLPGCTETSLLPKSAKHDGVEFTDLVKNILEMATTDYEGLR